MGFYSVYGWLKTSQSLMYSSTNINELVNEALLAYGKLAKLNPKGSTLRHWHDRDQIEALNESRELDTTGLTTFMMLRGLMDHFISSATFTAKHIFTQRDKFDAELASILHVLEMVENPVVTGIIGEFKAELGKMAEYFFVKDRKAYNDLISDKYDLAYVRRDALRSIERLDTYQFTQGKPDPEPLKVNGAIYEFWNINSLLAGLQAQNIAGVSLCLIRDPDEVMASYFAFAVRNGDTITILTDREEGAHPAFYRMSRRPARTLESRAERHWFPYHLLELKRTGDGRRLYAQERKNLVPYNAEAVKLKRIGELLPEEIVWTGLVLDLINERYGKNNLLLPQLSYTGEMVVKPEALVGNTSALVLSGLYKPLEVQPLKLDDVSAQTTVAQWERKVSEYNEWMIERYGEDVPEAVLNPVGRNQALQLEGKHKRALKVKRRHGMWPDTVEQLELESLSAVTFGTQEKLEKDRLWAARVNQCKIIQGLAEAEYEREHEKVLEWCQQRVKENRAYLLEACASGELILPHITFKSAAYNEPEHESFPRQDELLQGEHDALRQKVGKSLYECFKGFIGPKQLLLGRYSNRGRSRWLCAVQPDTTASVFSIIEPTCSEALGAIFKVSVSEMPFGLQNWSVDEPYTGNSILDRLDPSDWVLENPWRKLNLKVYVSLSKTAINEMRRRLDLPKRLWSETEEKKGNMSRTVIKV